MTSANKKTAVRQRMTQTGENYTTALRNLSSVTDVGFVTWARTATGSIRSDVDTFLERVRDWGGFPDTSDYAAARRHIGVIGDDIFDWAEGAQQDLQHLGAWWAEYVIDQIARAATTVDAMGSGYRRILDATGQTLPYIPASEFSTNRSCYAVHTHGRWSHVFDEDAAHELASDNGTVHRALKVNQHSRGGDSTTLILVSESRA